MEELASPDVAPICKCQFVNSMSTFLLCKNILTPILLPTPAYNAIRRDYRTNRVPHSVLIHSSHRYSRISIRRPSVVQPTLLHISSAPDAAVVICPWKVQITIAKAADNSFPLSGLSKHWKTSTHSQSSISRYTDDSSSAVEYETDEKEK